jgi:hypothetical protein
MRAMMAVMAGVGMYTWTTTPWLNEGDGGHGQTSMSPWMGE